LAGLLKGDKMDRIKVLLRDRKGFIYETTIIEFREVLYVAILKNGGIMFDTEHGNIRCSEKRILFDYKKEIENTYGAKVLLYLER